MLWYDENDMNVFKEIGSIPGYHKLQQNVEGIIALLWRKPPRAKRIQNEGGNVQP